MVAAAARLGSASAGFHVRGDDHADRFLPVGDVASDFVGLIAVAMIVVVPHIVSGGRLVIVEFDVAAVLRARRTTVGRLGGQFAGLSLVATGRAGGIARTSLAVATTATAPTTAAAYLVGTTAFAFVGALASQRFGVGLGERRRLAFVGEGSDVEFFLIAAGLAGFLFRAPRLTRRTIAARFRTLVGTAAAATAAAAAATATRAALAFVVACAGRTIALAFASGLLAGFYIKAFDVTLQLEVGRGFHKQIIERLGLLDRREMFVDLGGRQIFIWNGSARTLLGAVVARGAVGAAAAATTTFVTPTALAT